MVIGGGTFDSASEWDYCKTQWEHYYTAMVLLVLLNTVCADGDEVLDDSFGDGWNGATCGDDGGGDGSGICEEGYCPEGTYWRWF